MNARKLLLATLVAGTLGAALPAAARTTVDFYVNVPPPAPLYEAVPAPRAGFVWVPGYWEWRHGRHFWVGGHWLRERRGYYYAPGAWVTRGGRYYWNAPGWHRRGGGDRDHDGVPNRYDRAPNNPYRR
jgi:hypothetical protein